MPAIPTTTRAAVLHSFDADFVVEDVKLPQTLEPRALIVEIESATLCGSDIHQWKGEVAHTVLPVILGHEMVGRVVAMGEDADVDSLGAPVKVGDRVIWASPSCGRCYECTILEEPVLCPNRIFGSKQRSDQAPYAIGGLSQYAYIYPRSQRLVMDPGVPAAWVAAASCAGKTVMRAFRRSGGVRPGESVAILGSGPLGLFATALAKHSGAQPLLVAGAPAPRLNTAEKFGADATLDIGSMPDVDARIAYVQKAFDNGRGPKAVFDFAGGPSVFREAIHMVAVRGRVTMVGTVTPYPYPTEARMITRKELTVVGTHSADIAFHQDAVSFMTSTASRFDWDAMFSGPYTLDQSTSAMKQMSSLEVIKPFIRM